MVLATLYYEANKKFREQKSAVIRMRKTKYDCDFFSRPYKMTKKIYCPIAMAALVSFNIYFTKGDLSFVILIQTDC